MIEKYSLEQAAEEADILRGKVQTDPAKKYEDADDEHEREEVQAVLERVREVRKAMRPIEDIVFDLSSTSIVGSMDTASKQACLDTLFRKKAVFKDALNYHLTDWESVRSLSNLANVAIYGGKEKEDPYDNDFVKFALDQIEVLAPILEEKLKPSVRSGISIDLVAGLYEELIIKGNAKQVKAGVLLLDKYLDFFTNEIVSGGNIFRHIRRVAHIIGKGDAYERDGALRRLMDASAHVGKLDQAYMIRQLLETRNNNAMVRAYGMLSHHLKSYDVPDTAFFKAWLESTAPKEFPAEVEMNLGAMVALESKVAGICKYLYEEYGIMDFNRYPPELLLKQYQEREVTDKPYGVIVYPRNDYNGAFYQNKSQFAGLLHQLNGEFLLRVVECEDKMDVARMLMKLDKKYAAAESGHKISLLIVGGHGTEKSIQFGGRDKKHSLVIQDLQRNRIQRAGNFFDENLTIILNSCSTGADEGIARELKRVFKAKVIAPKVRTNILEYCASKNRGQTKFRFSARYQDKDARTVYKAGEE